VEAQSTRRGLATATDTALEIQARILDTTGLTASAGISYNKFLAKLASDQRKPNGQFVAPPGKGEAFVQSLQIGRFHGVGQVTEAKMKRLGVHTGEGLHRQSLTFLQHRPFPPRSLRSTSSSSRARRSTSASTPRPRPNSYG